MLFDVGVPASTIAKLLGKTERAVHLQVAADREKKNGQEGEADEEEGCINCRLSDGSRSSTRWMRSPGYSR
jgi:hypothetical protein